MVSPVSSNLDVSIIPAAVLRRLCFAFDVDGTLTRLDRTISPKTTQAIQAIFQAGGTAGVCTGRVYAVLPETVLNQFADSALHVVAGGSQIINQRGERLWGREFPGALIKELLQIVINNGGGYGFGIGKSLYVDPARQPKLQEWFPGIAIQEWTAVSDSDQEKISELVISGMNGRIRAALAQFADTITVKEMTSREGKINADVTLKGVTKATGLLALAQLRQIPIEETIAVGDDHNDLEMLAESWGVAMGNAVPEAKAVAKLVIDHTDNDGLAEFIRAVLAARVAAK